MYSWRGGEFESSNYRRTGPEYHPTRTSSYRESFKQKAITRAITAGLVAGAAISLIATQIDRLNLPKAVGGLNDRAQTALAEFMDGRFLSPEQQVCRQALRYIQEEGIPPIYRKAGPKGAILRSETNATDEITRRGYLNPGTVFPTAFTVNGTALDASYNKVTIAFACAANPANGRPVYVAIGSTEVVEKIGVIWFNWPKN